MRDRGLLHRNKLEEFRAWLEQQGFSIKEPKGDYEVLRWKGPKGKPMPIVYHNDRGGVHYTCNVTASKDVRRFINERKDNQ